MHRLEEQIRIRYPPFEAHRWHPEALPMAKEVNHIGDFSTIEDAKQALGQHGPSFQLGEENGWMAQRSYTFRGETLNVEHEQSFLETKAYTLPVKRQRRGWYLVPNPIHSIVRKYINSAVVVLLFALAYLFVSPVLVWLGLPTYGLDTVRWGLLDYPELAMYVIPLIAAPLLIRIGANLVELRRQNLFLQRGIAHPSVSFGCDTVADQSLSIQVNFSQWEDDWGEVELMWRVGLLAPSRERLLTSLNRSDSSQPPPGLSTELPHHWEAGLDDGTAGGEDAPMERRELKGGFYLRPMRIMAKSEFIPWKQGESTSLPPISPTWPGTVTTDLLRVHWECVVKINRKKGGSLLWVQPLRVAHSSKATTTAAFDLHDGRTELDSW